MSVQRFSYGKLEGPLGYSGYGMGACDDGDFVRIKDYMILLEKFEQQEKRIEELEAILDDKLSCNNDSTAP